MSKKQLETKILELENQLKRAVADYHNLEKRINEGRSELTSFVGAELIRKLLPALDHLEKSLDGISDLEKQPGWAKGVELAVKEFKQVLQSEGLDEIPIESGFDPSFHEAVDTEQGDDNKIIKVVRKGYTLNDRVVRPTQVVVGQTTNNHPEQPKEVEESNI